MKRYDVLYSASNRFKYLKGKIEESRNEDNTMPSTKIYRAEEKRERPRGKRGSRAIMGTAIKSISGALYLLSS